MRKRRAKASRSGVGLQEAIALAGVRDGSLRRGDMDRLPSLARRGYITKLGTIRLTARGKKALSMWADHPTIGFLVRATKKS